MQKEKQVKSYTRRTKSGKTVTVRAHTAKYDAAEEVKKALAKKKGAGDELEDKKSKKAMDLIDELKDLHAKEKVDKTSSEITADDYKAWYHWDVNNDPKNKTALKVQKALRAKMGASAYRKYFNELSDNYSSRGHISAFKNLTTLGRDKSSSPKEKKTSVKAISDTPVTSKKSTKKDYKTMSDEELSKALASHDNFPISKYRMAVSNAVERHYNDKTNGRDTTKSKAKLDEAKQKLKTWEATPEGKAYKTEASEHAKQSKLIRSEITRRKEAKSAANEKAERKALGGLVSGNTWEYSPSNGEFRMSNYTAWGKPESARVTKIIQKAESAGWKRANHSSSMSPDDKGYNETTRLISPDGSHELTYHYSAGDFSRNSHRITIRRIKNSVD